MYLRYIKGTWATPSSSSRNCSVNTDRWTAAVVAIDQLPRKIASVTDTKRKNKRHERR